MLDHVVAETVCEHLSRQRRDGDSGTFSLQNIAEVFEVGIPASDGAVFELESRDVGAADDLVVRVHAARCTVGLGIFDLLMQ